MLFYKRIFNNLIQNYPDKWIPAYSQVTFSPHIRYSDALARGNRQEIIMQEVMSMPDIETKWESEEVEKMILGKLIG